MDDVIVIVFCMLLRLAVVYCVECRETSLNSGSRSFNCISGCCGEIYQRYCCPTQAPFPLAAVIAGISIAGALFIALIVGLTVYMCKKPTQRRRVVGPHPQGAMHLESQASNSVAKDQLPAYEEPHQDYQYSSSLTGPMPPGYVDQSQQQGFPGQQTTYNTTFSRFD